MAIRTHDGLKFVIRYRERTSEGKWRHKAETLYGLSGKKAAQGKLDERIRESSPQGTTTPDLTLTQFIDTYWRPYLERQNVKPSTLQGYNSPLKALTNHLQNSQRIGAEDFVFSKSDGSTLDPDVLRRDVLYLALDRLVIPRSLRSAGFHSFRHSVGSFINAQTGNLKLAQKLLGHSNLSTTADIYTHTSEESEREAALAVERAIYGDLFSTVLNSENKNSGGSVQ